MNRYTPYLYGLALFIVAAGAGVYFYERPVDISHFSLVQPCAKPLPYTVGTIDPRFNVTKDAVIQNLAEAANLWNTAAGKSVLAYLPNDPNAVPVNFVYDSRQQIVSAGQQIDSTEASQNAARASLETSQTQYANAQQTYAAAVASFNAASASYSQEVRQINASGGADKQTYDRLQAEQASLEQQQTQLKAQGDALAAQGTALQARVDAFNASVHQINSAVNTFNSSVGSDFEEGQYVRDSSGKAHIDIYAYKDHDELIHSLAHEFGHALGLEHNQNPASIMFPYNKSGITLSSDDIAALKAACSLK